MSKFNVTKTMKTTNICGHAAYNMLDRDKLVTMVLTTMFNEKKYYGDNSSEIIELAKKVDAEFVAKLAVYARTIFNLRSVSHVLIAILANRNDGKQYVQSVISQSALRADDITEILSCYLSMFGKPIPNCLKKGLGKAMYKFNEYQFAKYNGGKKLVKFKDVLRITHARPLTTDMDILFGKILDDNLEIPYTWETELSAKGNTKEVWEELIDSGKVGYMALLRNLSNIIESRASNIDRALDILSNIDNVKRSKQLPFRYFSAYKTLQRYNKGSTKVYNALELALRASVNNMSRLKGRTLIAIDNSGSMGYSISDKSIITCADIAGVLGAIASYICDDVKVQTFNTSLRDVPTNSFSSILDTASNLVRARGGTNMELPFLKAIKDKDYYDRIIILSDNEVNGGYRGSTPIQALANKYKREVNPNVWVHAIDLQGYGTQQFIGKNVNIISGWSEKVLNFIDIAESGISNITETIDSSISFHA